VFEDDAKLKKRRNWNPVSGILFQVLFNINNLRCDLIVYFIGGKSDTSCVGEAIFPLRKENKMTKFDRDTPLTKAQNLADLYYMHVMTVNTKYSGFNPLAFEDFSQVLSEGPLTVALDKADRFATETFKSEEVGAFNYRHGYGMTKERNEKVIYDPDASVWVHLEAYPTFSPVVA
tara:strand:- start:7930 stop:8454 length:525 start_codon:yes stop_codon:yes gene_type:complete